MSTGRTKQPLWVSKHHWQFSSPEIRQFILSIIVVVFHDVFCFEPYHRVGYHPGTTEQVQAYIQA